MAGSEGPNPQPARSKLRENIVSLFALQGANYILPLIVVPYLVRVLGPRDYGRIAFSQAFIAYFIILVDYGFELSATQRIAALRERGEPIARYVVSVMTVKVALAVAGFLFVLAAIAAVPAFFDYRELFIVSYLNVVGTVVFPIWLYRGVQAMKIMSLVTILARAATVVGIFIFVHSPDDTNIANFIQSCGFLAAGIPALIIAPRLATLGFYWPRLHDLTETLVDGWHAFLSTSALTLYTTSNVFILGLFASPVAVGYYAAASKLITAASGLVSPVSQAVYPHIASLAAQSQKRALAFIGRLFWVQETITCLLSLAIFALAGVLVQVILGPKYQACVVLLRIMALVPFVTGAANIFGIQTMLAMGMKQAYSRIIVGAGVLNIAMLVPLILLAGPVGVAISVMLVELAAAAAMAVYLARRGLLAEITDIQAGLTDARLAQARLRGLWAR
jgi:PST family polysaccharide transporter